MTPERLEMLRQWSTSGEWTATAPPDHEELRWLVERALEATRLLTAERDHLKAENTELRAKATALEAAERMWARIFGAAVNVGTVEAARGIAEQFLAERDDLKAENARLADDRNALGEAMTENLRQWQAATGYAVPAWAGAAITRLGARVVLADRLAAWAQDHLKDTGADDYRWHESDPTCECLDCRCWDTLHAYLASAPVALVQP